jgi:hypothetical protein
MTGFLGRIWSKPAGIRALVMRSYGLAKIVQKSIEEFTTLIRIKPLGQTHSPSLPHHEERPQISSVGRVVDYIQPEGQSDSRRYFCGLRYGLAWTSIPQSSLNGNVMGLTALSKHISTAKSRN